MHLTAAQCRAARAYLRWTAADVAAAAGTGIMTVKRLEGGEAINPGSAVKIAEAFAAAGVTFITAGESSPDGGDGLRVSVTNSASGG